MPTDPSARRPLKTRDWPFFKSLASRLARSGVTPNTISFFSIVFGCCAGLAFAATAHRSGWMQTGFWLAAAAFIQLRLIANLLDGMVAVEGKKGGPLGDLWNEAPDRISDVATIVGAGFANGSSPEFGFSAALVAVFVAYIRALGASVGTGQWFTGPMAKPHRMALMTGVAVVSGLTAPFSGGSIVMIPLGDGHEALGFEIMKVALLIIILGGIVTAWRRLTRIATVLKEKAR